jgi:glycosyltransferase involved in cell wall biosynthesis
MTRKKIGIIFENNSNWIGGTYYILNLVSSFKTLSEENQPEVIIFSWNPEDLNLFKKIGYNHVSHRNFYIPYNMAERILFRIFPTYVKNKIVKRFPASIVDAVFPYDNNQKLNLVPKKIFWIPDFQEHYYPDFFNNAELVRRKDSQKKIAAENAVLILSSHSSEKDFQKFYPNSICKTKVVNFAVTHPEYKHLDIFKLKEKYQIMGNYFIAPNQFWIHKNHMIILIAMLRFKELFPNVQMVFTGKEYDHRSPGHIDILKAFVKDNRLTDHVLFLGFIDRAEQLQLMNHSLAVVQPSLFEGWSTLVEDAKSVGKFTIASDLDVHREQLGESAYYFDPKCKEQLVNCLVRVVKENPFVPKKNYQKNIREFAESFMGVLKSNV